MSFGDLMDTNADIKNIDIGRLRQICLEMWDSTSDDFPMLHRRYTDSDHAANHARLKTYIGDIVKLVGGFDGKPDRIRCMGPLVSKDLYMKAVSAWQGSMIRHEAAAEWRVLRGDSGLHRTGTRI